MTDRRLVDTDFITVYTANIETKKVKKIKIEKSRQEDLKYPTNYKDALDLLNNALKSINE